VLIGEFHTGAIDRGLPGGGLRTVVAQQDRADSYRYYVEQAAARPVAGRHTIWEIVTHCAYWMESVDKALHGEVMESIPTTEDWVGMGETAEDWTRDLTRMDQVYEKLQDTIAGFDSKNLDATVGSQFGENFFEFTNRKMLYGIADHNIYHAGQVSILKRK